ncbi:MAG: immune inhibitor A domain-containing protein [Candidatus Latescibacterota bacterium]
MLDRRFPLAAALLLAAGAAGTQEAISGGQRPSAASPAAPAPSGAQAVFVCAGDAHPVPAASPAWRVAAKLVGGSAPAGPAHVNALLICAAFSDQLVRSPLPPAYVAAIFDPERVGSFTHFYDTMSGGRLRVQGTALPGRYASSGPASRYVSADPTRMGDYGTFAQEVLAAVDRDVDFRLYDNDGPDGVPNSGDDDGYVDYVFLTVVSTPPGFILRRATGVANLGFGDMATADRGAGGRYLRVSGAQDHGCLVQEGNQDQTVGAMAHEFGHALGLPDLYDLGYSGPEEDSAGIGRWGLMGWGANGWDGASGPVAFCAYSLEQLGWIGPEDGSLVDVTLEIRDAPLRDPLLGGPVYRVWLSSRRLLRRDGTPQDGTLRQGYLLLERRQRGAHHYNRDIPAEGLLVWHVQPAHGTNRLEETKLVDLLCADGAYRDAGFPAGRHPDPQNGRDNLDFWAHDAAYATVHGGNMGDATDPFDGERFTVLGADSNPALLSAHEFAGMPARLPAVRARRRGPELLVDVTPLTWAGVLRREAGWDGTVLVDGDLEVARDGDLMLQPGCRVLVAPRDRLRRGLDRSLVEITVRGALSARTLAGDLRFAGLAGPASWYGLVVVPADSPRVDLGPSRLEVEDAVHGVSFLGAPPGANGLTLTQFTVDDTPGADRAGNGDGLLQPGETFRIGLEVTNYSVNTVADGQLTMRWPVAAVHPLVGRETQFQPPRFTLGPGGRRTFGVRSLTLEPQEEGGTLAFTLSLTPRARAAPVWRDTVAFTVGADPGIPEVEMLLPGHDADLRSAVVSTADRFTVEARPAAAGVERLDLLVLNAAGAASQEVSLQAASAGLFTGQVQLERGTYELLLRAHDASGASLFLPQRWEINAAFTDWQPVLALLESRSGATINTLRRALNDGLGEAEVAGTILYASELEGYETDLLQQHLGPGKVVITTLGAPSALMQQALVRYLQTGGRLCIASPTFHRRFSEELRGLLPFSEVRGASRVEVRGTGPLEDLRFTTSQELLEPFRPPSPSCGAATAAWPACPSTPASTGSSISLSP